MTISLDSLRGWIAVGCLGTALLGLLSSSVAGEPRAPVAKVLSIPVKGRAEAVLEDVCSSGLLLLNGITMGMNPELLLSDPQTGRPQSEIPMRSWVDAQAALYKANEPWQDGPFRCVAGGKQVAAVLADDLVLLDTEGKPELRRVRGPQRDPRNPFNRVMWHANDRAMSVNPRDGSLAVAFNGGSEPRVYIYGPDLRKLIGSWALPRYIEDICWSPDGEKLGALYSGAFDGKNEFVGANPHFKLTGIPDVEVFGANSAKSLLRFFSGDLEGKVAFSPDGGTIYTITLARYHGFKRWGRGAIRAFSAEDGRLVRILRVPGTGVRNNFALSPDGRLIVADASTPAPKFFLREMIADTFSWQKVARFVILDAQTGKLMFEHHEKTPGQATGVVPMRFGFSPDGKLLFVDANHAGWGRDSQVDVYSVEGLY